MKVASCQAQCLLQCLLRKTPLRVWLPDMFRVARLPLLLQATFRHLKGVRWDPHLPSRSAHQINVFLFPFL